MRMSAAVMTRQGLCPPYVESQPFRIESVDLEGPKDGEVLVEVRAAGLCHSDLSQVQGFRKRPLPYVGGHEGAGVVREVGAGIDWLRAGDHVVMTVAAGCGHCGPCSDLKPVLCNNVLSSRLQGVLSNGARRLGCAQEPVYHYSGISSFAEYAVCTPNSLIRIDPAVPLEVAAIFGCAVVTGAGAVFNTADVRLGQSVLVLGLGGTGLNAVMAARLAGAETIVGVDIDGGKFPLAQELGCTHTFAADDPDLTEHVADLTGGGVHAAFEMSGAETALQAAIDATRKGGQIICVGVSVGDGRPSIAHTALVTQEKVIRGSYLGSVVPQRDIPRYAGMYLAGKFPVDRLLSGSEPLRELNAALDNLDQGKALRQIILPHA